jgi:hypothetical protein
MEQPTFEAFRKIARLSRECTVTEKIDGTNGQIYIFDNPIIPNYVEFYVGSRTRWLSEKGDNHGFYKWAMANKDELMKLGPGRHYGEWWGSGIQRGYGLVKGDKRFSLFNTHIWTPENKPACCEIVPVLYQGLFTENAWNMALIDLIMHGSHVAPFMNPEGIVIYHQHAGMYFKKTISDDAAGKGRSA